MNNNEIIKKCADYLVKMLKQRGFIIQRYDAYSTNSVYLKLDYGVCNSIRIGDHQGKEKLRYRYNVIIGGENNIIEEKYIRYFYNENSLKDLFHQILFDKVSKLEKYGKNNYSSFMAKNINNHKDDRGFWKDAKIISDDTQFDVTIKIPKSRQLESTSKFKIYETVKVSASFDELVNYFVRSTETINQAKEHAMLIKKGMQGCDVGQVLSIRKCEDGMYYTLELPLIPMEVLPEDFLRKVQVNYDKKDY